MTITRDTWVEITDEFGNTVEAFHWPFCEIPGCPNRICTGRSERFCWPHSGSGKSLQQIIHEADGLVCEAV